MSLAELVDPSAVSDLRIDHFSSVRDTVISVLISTFEQAMRAKYDDRTRQMLDLARASAYLGTHNLAEQFPLGVQKFLGIEILGRYLEVLLAGLITNDMFTSTSIAVEDDAVAHKRTELKADSKQVMKARRLIENL